MRLPDSDSIEMTQLLRTHSPMHGAMIANLFAPPMEVGMTNPRSLQRFLCCAPDATERSRIRNTRPTVTFDDLANLRWKCGTCDEWHTGPCLDFSEDAPYYWTKEHEKANNEARSLS